MLAIDPGLNHVGWAVFEAGRLVDSGVIRVNGETLAVKLSDIQQGVRSLSWGDITMAIIEIPGKMTYARSSRNGKALNQDSIHKLCMATGAIIGELRQLRCAVETAVADEWKRNFSRRQFAAGKDFFLAAAKQIAGREIKTDHEADAICLGWWWNKAGAKATD